MATLANQGVASQASFGQLGSGFVDSGAAYAAPSGSVVVAITCLSDTTFSVLTSEDGTKYFGTGGDGAGTNSEAVVVGNIFPQGITIYGKWTHVTATADTDAGIILYLGPSNSPNQTA